MQAQSSSKKIDAAFSVGDSLVYFFKDDKVLRVDWIHFKLEAARPIHEQFPGMPFTNLEAAVTISEDTVLFFSKGYFMLFDPNKRCFLNPYPTAFNDSPWNTVKESPRAGLCIRQNQSLLFSNTDYSLVDYTTEKYKKYTAKPLNTLKWPGDDQWEIEAAFQINNIGVLVSKGKYINIDLSSQKIISEVAIKLPNLDDFEQQSSGLLQQHTPSYLRVQEIGGALLYTLDPKFVLFSDSLMQHSIDTTENTTIWLGQKIAVQTQHLEDQKEAMYVFLALLDACWDSIQHHHPTVVASASTKHYFKGRYLIRISKDSVCRSLCVDSSGGLLLSETLFPINYLQQQLMQENPFVLPDSLFLAMATIRGQHHPLLSLRGDQQQASKQLWMNLYLQLNSSYLFPTTNLPIDQQNGRQLQSSAIQYLGDYLRQKKHSFQLAFDIQHQAVLAEAQLLLPSIFHYIFQNFGKNKAYQRMFTAFDYMDRPERIEDLIDNYFLLACFAAQKDLQSLFEKQFKFKLSDFVKQKIAVLKVSEFSLNEED